MAKNLTVRLDDELAADAEALARAEGKSLNEAVKLALAEAVDRRRQDPKFKARVKQIIAWTGRPHLVVRGLKACLSFAASLGSK